MCSNKRKRLYTIHQRIVSPSLEEQLNPHVRRDYSLRPDFSTESCMFRKRRIKLLKTGLEKVIFSEITRV